MSSAKDSSKSKSKGGKPSSSKPVRQSSIELMDDDYEMNLYKPRHLLPTRRRQ